MTATAAPLPGLSLPEEAVARVPPEARGLRRDGVRLMVSRLAEGSVGHARFVELPDLLCPGDVLVVNASATFAAAVDAVRAGSRRGRGVVLHLSTSLGGGRWAVELRRRTGSGTGPLLDAEPGEVLLLPRGAKARLLQPYAPGGEAPPRGAVRLWTAALALPMHPLVYTSLFGSPVRYAYVSRPWPLSWYQTLFSEVAGSAEMPSAGRPFTLEVRERLRRRGVGVVRVLLHTGVSSLEAGEPPYPERYRVPERAAEAVNRARARGGRVVAVGTTVVRALESVASGDGHVRAGRGWTDLVVTPERGVLAVDAILTGLHGPDASHLSMLAALAGEDHLALAYESALRQGYLWHEFGDVHLILP